MKSEALPSSVRGRGWERNQGGARVQHGLGEEPGRGPGSARGGGGARAGPAFRGHNPRGAGSTSRRDQVQLSEAHFVKVKFCAGTGGANPRPLIWPHPPHASPAPAPPRPLVPPPGPCAAHAPVRRVLPAFFIALRNLICRHIRNKRSYNNAFYLAWAVFMRPAHCGLVNPGSSEG